MQVYLYRIKTIDPIFFAHEGISGAFTTPYIHATALNHAVRWAKGDSFEDQSYIINEHRNEPHYQSSKITDKFYLTPARVCGNAGYYPEFVKGDGDKFIQAGYGKTKIKVPLAQVEKTVKRRFHNELLKAYPIFSISPETEFEGYLYSIIPPDKFPELIRLGSFRGLAQFKILEECKILSIDKNKPCQHPVDPLVHKPKRGVLIPMLPYPIVESPVLEDVFLIKRRGQNYYIATFREYKRSSPEVSKGGIEIF